ncbi:hypothetical protein NC653_009105 [Populus alba x Populus x berolinensis]|uniref:Protein kinase domain-containing protein n=1 Tax=Populus alba x Populus x berolinensis TaxID=444605 RepID=A0AAD6R8J3_9ROSI|nr:hypothetical protein NC653_009105 [Populus alba x Populus x berolinensis]
MAATNQFSSLQQPCKWVKGKVIGSGSQGTVHLAINKVTGGLFVAKSALSGVDSKYLEHEANILESLDSPYMIRCMGKGWQKGSDGGAKLNVFIEYMAGGSLSDIAEKFGGALEEEVIRLYTKQILNGLKYLHENGIVHCDLKCKNVLLGLSGNIKLADFGCAKRLKDLDRNGKFAYSWQSVGGTPLWMAPEVLRKEGLDFASDIWSLGCAVIEMATGRPPWGCKASNPMAVVLKIACSNERPNFPVHFSEEGMDFLDKCLERNPESRWTAEELLDHPFIAGNSQKKYVCSPASVLDNIGTYEEDYDSDESRNPDEHLRWNPFSMRNCGKPKIVAMRQHADNDSVSSGDWITVRSEDVKCEREIQEAFYLVRRLKIKASRVPRRLPGAVGDWRIKREESYDDDEAVEEIENSMGGCCCGSAKGAADQFDNAPPFYYYSRTSEEHVSLSSHQAPGSVLQSTGLLVDTNLDTSVPDAYRPPPAPTPFDAAVGRPQTPGRLREVRGDKNHGALQTTTSASGQENTALNTRETLAKCEDAKDLDCKVQINSEPGSAKELEIELSKPVEPLVSATEEEEEEDCPICLEEYDLENPKLTTKCEHHFHLSCILEWMERSESCPVCDKEMIFDPPID